MQVENIKISDGVPANRTPAARVEDTKCEPVASPAKVAPPTAANASGDASHDTSGWEEDEVEGKCCFAIMYMLRHNNNNVVTINDITADFFTEKMMGLERQFNKWVEL